MQNEKMFGTGAIHTEDERDVAYMAAAGVPETLPDSYQTQPLIAPLMQAQIPSCVSHAWVRLLQFYWYKKTGKIIDFSPRFLHAITSKGMSPEDGRDPRVIGNILTDHSDGTKGIGCCTNALLPNDTSLDPVTYQNVTITQAMLDEAKQYTIPAYSFVPIDQYSIRHAIYHKGAVALLFYVGNEWWTPSYSPKDINPLRPPKVVVSGHEVAGEHWKGNLEGIENSWDKFWCDMGYAEYNLGNYAPRQVIVIDDPAVDFNPPVPTPVSTKFVFTKNLSYGMTDPDVAKLQVILGMPVKYQTGYYGFITAGYVLAYQITHGIYPTAEFNVGPKTRAILNNS